MPEIANPDLVIPLVIIGACLLIMAIVALATRGRPNAAAELGPAQGERPQDTVAGAPITGQSQVTAAQLGVWYRNNAGTVQQWIENHEIVLKRVSDDGLSINLNEDLTDGHVALSAPIDRAIGQHPAPQMRAQLSSLVQASRSTIDALRRSNWTAAEKEHLNYLQFRDVWLERLRDFASAEAEEQRLAELRKISEEAPLPSWLDRDRTPPG